MYLQPTPLTGEYGNFVQAEVEDMGQTWDLDFVDNRPITSPQVRQQLHCADGSALLLNLYSRIL